MNKTISINLNGMLFYLEEGAYNRLFQYLKDRKRIVQPMQAQANQKKKFLKQPPIH